MKIVLAKFLDPTTYDHWADMEEISDSKAHSVYACGFLIEDNEEYMKIALLRDGWMGRGWIDIPQGCVQYSTEIKEVDFD